VYCLLFLWSRPPYPQSPAFSPVKSDVSTNNHSKSSTSTGTSTSTSTSTSSETGSGSEKNDIKTGPSKSSSSPSRSSPPQKHRNPPAKVLSNRSLDEAQCNAYFPGLTAEIDRAVAEGPFTVKQSGDLGPLQGRIRDGQIYVLHAQRKADLSREMLNVITSLFSIPSIIPPHLPLTPSTEAVADYSFIITSLAPPPCINSTAPCSPPRGPSRTQSSPSTSKTSPSARPSPTAGTRTLSSGRPTPTTAPS